MVRASGTEALIRVMVEASDQATAERIADQVADVISVELVVP
jgi:phosphoglucosamine mutase